MAIWGPPVYEMDVVFFCFVLFCFFCFCFVLFFCLFLRQLEQSAVKLVVRVLKSVTVLYKTHAYISLLNVTFVCSCLLIYSI